MAQVDGSGTLLAVTTSFEGVAPKPAVLFE